MEQQSDLGSVLGTILDPFILNAGFHQWGITQLERPLSFHFYESWVNNGYHGEMKYLESHLKIKEQPQEKWPGFQSVLVFSIPYYPVPNSEFPVSNLKVSFYAQNVDYHYWVKEKLASLVTSLKTKFPAEEFTIAVDASPLMERDLSHRAGLGWFGKNTCLIHPKKGSLFFLAEVLTTMKFESTPEPLPDFCGKCTKCMDACPTQAIEAPKLLNAQKCISYWTIESRDLPPVEIRNQIGSWFFGCDICQTICPWNQKIFGSRIHRADPPNEKFNREKTIEELRWILNSSGKALQKAFLQTPLSRAGSFGLKRNAIIVAGNLGLIELKQDVDAFAHHEKLKDLVPWFSQKIMSHT